MTTLDDYRDRYDNVALCRSDDGVLDVRLHSDDGPLVWTAVAHQDLGLAFTDIARDPDNRVVVLGGTGDVFCDHLDPAGFKDFTWDVGWYEGRHLLQALVDISVPVVGVLNGPASVHAELVMLSDLIVAADTATLADRAHFVNGAVPGDGVQVVWPALLGPNAGRAFLLTGDAISAADAHDLGLVAEVVPAGEAHKRALARAQDMATKSTNVLRYTRELLISPFRRALHGESLSNGLALEGMPR